MIKSPKEYFEKVEIVNDYLNKHPNEPIESAKCDEIFEIREWNKTLCDAYPFLRYRDWTSVNNEPIDGYYYSTILDDMPEGWYIAFGLELAEEINHALYRGGIEPKDYVVDQVKEKFGGLRWYDSNSCKEVHEVIDKYEDKSYHTCCDCGNPAVWETTGWICPYCDDCARKLFNRKRTAYRNDNTTFENCGYFKRIKAGGSTYND